MQDYLKDREMRTVCDQGGNFKMEECNKWTITEVSPFARPSLNGQIDFKKKGY